MFGLNGSIYSKDESLFDVIKNKIKVNQQEIINNYVAYEIEEEIELAIGISSKCISAANQVGKLAKALMKGAGELAEKGASAFSKQVARCSCTFVVVTLPWTAYKTYQFGCSIAKGIKEGNYKDPSWVLEQGFNASTQATSWLGASLSMGTALLTLDYLTQAQTYWMKPVSQVVRVLSIIAIAKNVKSLIEIQKAQSDFEKWIADQQQAESNGKIKPIEIVKIRDYLKNDLKEKNVKILLKKDFEWIDQRLEIVQNIVSMRIAKEEESTFYCEIQDEALPLLRERVSLTKWSSVVNVAAGVASLATSTFLTTPVATVVLFGLAVLSVGKQLTDYHTKVNFVKKLEALGQPALSV